MKILLELLESVSAHLWPSPVTVLHTLQSHKVPEQHVLFFHFFFFLSTRRPIKNRSVWVCLILMFYPFVFPLYRKELNCGQNLKSFSWVCISPNSDLSLKIRRVPELTNSVRSAFDKKPFSNHLKIKMYTFRLSIHCAYWRYILMDSFAIITAKDSAMAFRLAFLLFVQLYSC